MTSKRERIQKPSRRRTILPQHGQAIQRPPKERSLEEYLNGIRERALEKGGMIEVHKQMLEDGEDALKRRREKILKDVKVGNSIEYNEHN